MPTKEGGSVSTGGKWSDSEKMQVFFSIMEQMAGPIPWDRVALPEGRSVKAAQCMVDVTKRALRTLTGDAEGGSAPGTPQKPRGKNAGTPKAKGTRKLKEVSAETKAAQKRKRAAAKNNKDVVKTEEASEEDQGVVKTKEVDEDTDVEELLFNTPDHKKVKIEEEATGETGEMATGDTVEDSSTIKGGLSDV